VTKKLIMILLCAASYSSFADDRVHNIYIYVENQDKLPIQSGLGVESLVFSCNEFNEYTFSKPVIASIEGEIQAPFKGPYELNTCDLKSNELNVHTSFLIYGLTVTYNALNGERQRCVINQKLGLKSISFDVTKLEADRENEPLKCEGGSNAMYEIVSGNAVRNGKIKILVN
jgi:hypothetical protein